VIPLRIGGGTRIKVYEAMAMGKAIVSTRIGVEGLPVTDRENVVLSEGPEEFADAVVRLLRDAKERAAIASSARSFVERNFSWEKAAKIFSDACLNAIGDQTQVLFGPPRESEISDFKSFATLEQK
jgi:glycosyltransferase involved in cell wall biosynthesis